MSEKELPEEIVLRKDYSCYCKVCECNLSRIKDALQHAAGKRHQRACITKKEKLKNSVKREAEIENNNEGKKIKTDEEIKEDEETKKKLSELFDETFHGGVIALKDNYYCKVCRCMIGNNRKNVNQHKDGKSHKVALEQYKKSLLSGNVADESEVSVEMPSEPFEGDGYIQKTKNARKKNSYYCTLCDFRTKDRTVITEHMHGRDHELNVMAAKEKEMMEHNAYGRGEQGMRPLQGEFYGEMEMPMLPFNRQNPPHQRGLGFQQDIEPNIWNQKNFTPGIQENFQQQPGFMDQQMHPDPLLLQQMMPNQQAALSNGPPFQPPMQGLQNFQPIPGPFFPSPQPQFFPHPSPNAVPFMPQPHQTPLPFMTQTPDSVQSQQNVLLAQSSECEQEPDEESQTKKSECLPGFITCEADAQIVIDVINSLLKTYLKYRLNALPGSFLKLLCKSSKTEDNITRISKFDASRTTKQIFINVQNHKNQSSSSNDKKVSKTSANESASVNEDTRRRPMDSKGYSSYNAPHQSETRDSYDKRSYIEDEINRASFATRKNNVLWQNENYVDEFKSSSYQDRTSRSSKNEDTFTRSRQPESIIDLFKQYRHPAKENQSLKSTQKKPHPNDLFKQFKSSTNDDKPSQSIRQSEPSSADFSNRYKSSSIEGSSVRNNRMSDAPAFSQQRAYLEDTSSRNMHPKSQAIFDLLKKRRNSDNFPRS